jgi:phosphoglycerol transferase MdoB-like AlkP superfamily enzyme
MRRFTLPLAVGAAVLAVSFLVRLALALRGDVHLDGLAQWLNAFGFGLLYDLVTALYAAGPLVFAMALAPSRLTRSRLFGIGAFLVFALAAWGLSIVAVSEWLFWDEFGARFNFIAVDYLLYTHEVIGNIRESYPVGRILAALALPPLAAAWLLRRRLARSGAAALGWRAAAGVVLAYGLAVAAATQWVDTDMKNRTANDAANELAGNGVYEFFAANRRNELSYDRHYAVLPLGEALARVRLAFDGDGTRWIGPLEESIERSVKHDSPARKLNVVLVSIESMGAEFLGTYGNPKGLTPRMDQLARESLWLSNLYATGNRTVRGLEALTLAQPPTPGQSILRRPKNEALFSLGSVFEDNGYEVIYAYGGYGYFDNMNAFFDANDYRAVDRRSIAASRIEFENVWGVADEHLFDHVLEELDREQAAPGAKPFFIHVMTTSNHRPYTYPPGRIDIPSGSGRDGAVKYSDYAVGRFLDMARGKPWFPNTLFVITADHGANARGTMEIPVDRYLIPAFFYAPGLLAPRRVERLASQIDISPTILGLLGLPYYSKFLGRDLLTAPAGSDRAFVANYQTLGYLKDGKLVLLQPKRKTRVVRLDRDGRVLGPARDDELVYEAIAFYEVASHAFRAGWLADEEQVPPEKRTVMAPAGPHAGRKN